MITLPRRSFLLGAATLAAPALIIRTPGLPPKVVPSLLMPEKLVPEQLVQVVYKLILHGCDEAGRPISEVVLPSAAGQIHRVTMTREEFESAVWEIA
jgi:hypothetical protein